MQMPKASSRKQFQMEGSRFKNSKRKTFKGSQTAWNNLIKPGLQLATSLVSAVVAAKTKNRQPAQKTSKTFRD